MASNECGGHRGGCYYCYYCYYWGAPAGGTCPGCVIHTVRRGLCLPQACEDGLGRTRRRLEWPPGTTSLRTVAWDDEPPMNHAKVPKVCSLCSPYDARVTEVSCRAGFIPFYRPAIYGPGVPSSPTGTRPACIPQSHERMASRILGLTPGRIRQMLRAGELEGL
jgi:hypothetical protein